MIARLALVLLVPAGLLSGCGGDDNIVRTCDEQQSYQLAAESKKVAAPEGLDELEEYREMPIPRATQRAPRPPGSPCIDLPPSVRAD